MSNKDKNFYFGCLIAFLIGVIILLLCNYTDFPIVKSFEYFAWGAVLITGIIFIELGIRFLFKSKNDKDKK